MHTLNAVLLLGDTALNCLRVPFYRISFFLLWTGVFVIFQWIIRAFVSNRWPYPFLDLSSPYAPIWCLLMALMHLPYYGIFALIVKVQLYLLSKLFCSLLSVLKMGKYINLTPCEAKQILRLHQSSIQVLPVDT
ncbi:uncharacterized protein LOC132182526 [Corylus avellana]|uniref:uncharacterized protein LOC132182526 n=1 Tax=Corylus avellana TaxID=13451 RepID=UPI00286A3BD6|nr:uncharacterized protein LOC132182526 [Corylus avellana]